MSNAEKKEKHRKTGIFIQNITKWYQHAFIILTIMIQSTSMSNFTMMNLKLGSIILPQQFFSQNKINFKHKFDKNRV